MAKQTPLTCSGHTRPVVDLAFSQVTEDGYFMISACKGMRVILFCMKKPGFAIVSDMMYGKMVVSLAFESNKN